MKPILYVFVAVAGALTAVEAGANAAMDKALNGVPWWPALLFTAVSAVCLAAAALVAGEPVPWRQLGAVPWWGWSGGVISAVYVISMLVAPGRLGAGLFTGLTISAALLTSIALDHWGLVGFPVHAAGAGRLLGAALMVAGLVLVARY